jgi:AraC-like DNA-binding protein
MVPAINPAAMFYCTHVPAQPLSEFVDWFWFFEGLDVPHRRERVLPDGSTELVINLDDSRRKLFDREQPHRFQTFHRAWVSGARSDYILIDVLPQSSMIGVHFKPGGLVPFLKMPASELTGQVIELDTLWGRDAADLRDRLLEANGVRVRFHVLEEFLLRRAVRPLTHHPAVAHALGEWRQAMSAVRVRQVADSLGFSHKHFIDLFRDAVGLTPKRYCRVRRFQQALTGINRGQSVDWTEVALDAGYYDQAHFVHDFTAFSGLKPSEYLTRRNGEMNFVPADE